MKSISGLEEVKALPYVHRNQLDNLHVGMDVPVEKLNKTNRLALIVEAESEKQWLERVAHIQDILHVECESAGTTRDLVWK